MTQAEPVYRIASGNRWFVIIAVKLARLLVIGMRYCKSVLCIMILLGLVPVASAEMLKLFIPDDFDVLYINDTKQKTYLLSRSDSYAVNIGDNQLILRYKQFWGDDDDFEKVVSDDFYVSFYIDDKADHKLTFPKLKDAEAAKRFIKQPSLILKNISTGIETVATVRLLANGEADFLAASARSESAVSSQSLPRQTHDANDTELVEKLLRLWEKANQQERQAFLKQIL